MSEFIKQQREIIDNIDSSLIDLLEKRFHASLEVGKQKRVDGIDILDCAREQAVLESRASYGQSKGLRPEFIHRLMQLIMEESKSIQAQLD